jgi:SAM-dependent methyltransferase
LKRGVSIAGHHEFIRISRIRRYTDFAAQNGPRQMTDENFDRYASYYDLLNEDKDYEAEVEYIKRCLGRLGIGEGALLEFGSGTGRHGRLLAQSGYKVLGVDRSHAMVERAQSAGPAEGFSCQVGDVKSLHLERSFDAVLALFHVVSYQTGNDDVLATFRNARAHLRSGGVFLFDIWYAPAVHAQRPLARRKHVENDTHDVIRIAEPDWRLNENRVDVRYTIRVIDKKTKDETKFEEMHPVRYFSLPELDLVAAMTGFRREIAEEFLTEQAPSDGSWSVCVGLQAV